MATALRATFHFFFLGKQKLNKQKVQKINKADLTAVPLKAYYGIG